MLMAVTVGDEGDGDEDGVACHRLCMCEWELAVGWSLVAGKLGRKNEAVVRRWKGDGVDVMMAAGWGEAGDAAVYDDGGRHRWPEFGRIPVTAPELYQRECVCEIMI
ncbi:hypothetical protein Tco_1053872 [Tanacetum coccineum]|uniref:Uncharacterized protein n=1 Tax=Tanacetum coccineum TaxID=301880 RepID=A0ABQ5GWR2_9ASTR